MREALRSISHAEVTMRRRTWRASGLVFSLVLLWMLTPGPSRPAGAQASGYRLEYDGAGHFAMNGNKKFLLGVYDSGIGPYSTADAWNQALFNTLTSKNASSTRGLGHVPINMYLNYTQGNDSAAQIEALLQALSPSQPPVSGALPNHDVMWLQTANCSGSGGYKRYETTYGLFSADADGGLFEANLLASPHASQLAGYYLMDECDDSLLAETQDHHRTLLGYDPNAINFAVPVAYGYREPGVWVTPDTQYGTIPSAGLFGTDPYPLYGAEPRMGYPHFRVPDHIARLRARQSANPAVAANPVVAVLQLFKFNGGRLPTPGEMKMHAYASIVEGAQGIFWWSLGTGGLRGKGVKTTEIVTWTGYLQNLVTELASINDALVSPPPTDPLLYNSSSVLDATGAKDPVAWRKGVLGLDTQNTGLAYTELQWYQDELNALNQSPPDTSRSPMITLRPDQSGDIRTRTFAVTNTAGTTHYLVAYNYTNRTENVTFGWSWAPSSLGVLGESRSYPLPLPQTSAGYAFSDQFGPYAAHVYVIR
jgi:hypothetical protein